MLLPDLSLLAVVLALAAWRLFAPAWRPRLRIAAVALALLLAAAQWALCDFTWQDLPAYFLLAVSALPPVRTGTVLRWLGHLGLVGIAAAAIGVWILPAVPTLPQPDGRYAVATQVYRWTDAARDEPHTADPTDRRSVIAQAWYPTTRREHPSGVARLAYIDGIDHMPGQVSVMPGFMLHRYGQIDTHAENLAPLAPSDRPWPVVIFSPGYGAPRAVYTGLATRLASRGFVVFALDHPYESAVTQLPDGRVVGTREIFLPGDRDRTRYMARQQVVRVADVRFVIDQLAHPEALSPPLRGGRIDASKVAVIGHSFGGAASIAALSEDPRVVAAANIDGTPYGDLPDRQLTRPFLLLQSDYAETHHGDFFINGNGKLLAHMTAPGFHYEIKHANHYSFTDAPFFFAPPGRWLLTQVMGGGRGPAATQQAAADILAAFLTGPLTGAASDLAATAARYPEVLGGAVEHKLGRAQAFLERPWGDARRSGHTVFHPELWIGKTLFTSTNLVDAVIAAALLAAPASARLGLDGGTGAEQATDGGIAPGTDFGRLYRLATLLRPGALAESMRTVDQRTEVRRIRRGAEVSLLRDHTNGSAAALPSTYVHGGRSSSIEAFLERTGTTGLIVLRGDTILFERYYRGTTAASRTFSWSLSKSVVSALIGVAVGDGLVRDIREPVSLYVPKLAGSGFDGVSIKDVLQMSSGVRGEKDDGGDGMTKLRMFPALLSGGPLDDVVAALASARPPGTYHQYHSANTQVLGMVLRAAAGRSIAHYAEEKLWGPLGMEADASWLVDGAGIEVAPMGLSAVLRDQARFGLLYLRNGRTRDRQILPEAWVRASVTPDAAHLVPGKHELSDRLEGYGYHWWIPQEPEGDFMALGAYGQAIYVSPRHDIVIARSAAYEDYNKDGYEMELEATAVYKAMSRSID